MTDTQGANCVGCYGDPRLQTPNLDRLAAEGLRLTQAYTTCPVCTPARSAIFTGCYPHTNGAMGNEIPLHANIKTLGQRLRDSGIAAGYTGKWHLSGLDYFDTGICPDGWEAETWFDGRNHLDSLPGNLRSFSRSYQTTQSYNEAGFTVEHTFAHGVTERAISFIARHQHEDFCLVVSYDEPHHPSMAPPPFSDLHHDYALDTGAAKHDDLDGKPELQRRWAERVRHVNTRTKDGCYVQQAYFASNTFVDHEIGRVLTAIGTQAPEALVVYTSDHGEMMHAHQLHSKGPAMYHEITRIPFLVRWPGVIRPGTVRSEPFSQIDITPTILDFFGLTTPAYLEGRSRLPEWRGERAADGQPIFLEFNRFSIASDEPDFTPIRCAFDGRYKLSLNLFDRDELYDLQSDPAENVNRIEDAALAAERDRLHQAIIEWMHRTRDPLRGSGWSARPWSARPPVPTKARRYYPDDGYMPRPRNYMTAHQEE